MRVPEPPEIVASKLGEFPQDVLTDLLGLRECIFVTAGRDQRTGELEESLKWGEPAYRPKRPRTGTTLRLGWRSNTPDDLLLFVHCRTNLIERFRTICGSGARFEGQRALVLSRRGFVSPNEVEACIATALTYHLGPRDI